MNQSTGRPSARPPETPSIACTNCPPKRVLTFALRCSTRMTVSAPATSASGSSTNEVAPKSRVMVSDTGALGVDPAPRPQPPSATAHSATSAAALPDMEDDAIAATTARVVAVVGLVDRVDVEDVAPARQARGQQVARLLAVPDAEPEAVGGAALDVAKALGLAAERRAAAAV